MKLPQLVAFSVALAAAACVSTGFYPMLVSLPVGDVKASEQWYVRNAGFVLRSETADGAILERERFQLALVKRDAGAAHDFVKIAFHDLALSSQLSALRRTGAGGLRADS